MSRWLKSPVFYSLLALALGLRYWQAEQSFKAQQQVLGPAPKGLFRVWVSEEPEVLFDRLPGSHATGRSGRFYQSFVREVRAVCTLVSLDGRPEPPMKLRCTFRLSAGPPPRILSYGDVVEVEGKIQWPQPAMNPGQFDYAHYLKTKGVAYVIYAGAGKWWKVESSEDTPRPDPLPQGERVRAGGDATPSFASPTSVIPLQEGGHKKYGIFFLRWSCALKRAAEDAIYRCLPFPENALLDGILLGERSPLPDEVVQSFFLTGTIHILAVSGMITAFIAGLLFMVFRALQFRRKWAAGSALAGLLLFVFMTGAHPPVCRAGLFSALALSAVLFERRIHGGVLLMATAVLLIALNPFVMEDLSFQISFLATAGLMVMAPGFMEKLFFLWRPAARLATATTAAQLAVWVLIVYDFNQLSVYSILSNLLIVPLSLFSTAGGLVLLAGAAVHPALGTLFGAACEPPLRLLIWLSDSLARLPRAEWIVASPPLAWVLGFHALLLILFAWFWPHPRPEKPSENWKRRWEGILRGRRWVVRAWVLFFLATGVAWGCSATRTRPLRITFLDVGHGNAVVLRSPQGRVLVVDGGKETRGSDRYSLVVSYLRHLGVEKVEGVLDSQPDDSHVGGLVNVLGAYPVATAYEGGPVQSGGLGYQEFLEAIDDRHVKLERLKEGDRIAELQPAPIAILHPPDNFHPRLRPDNNRSLVSLVSFGGFNLVLPGDLEKDGLVKLLRDNQPFPWVDWLMAPRHGRWSGEPLLCAKAFRPRFVVLSDWRDYPDDHADFQSVVPGAVVLSTAVEGAIEVELWPEGRGRYRTWRNSEWKGFSRQSTVDSPQ